MNNRDRGKTKRQVYKMIDSPVGRLTLVATDDGVAAILWENDRPNRVRLTMDAEDNEHPRLVEAERQLKQYFSGERRDFDVALDVTGTPFQRRGWAGLMKIPLRETRADKKKASQIRRARAGPGRGAGNGGNTP